MKRILWFTLLFACSDGQILDVLRISGESYTSPPKHDAGSPHAPEHVACFRPDQAPRRVDARAVVTPDFGIAARLPPADFIEASYAGCGGFTWDRYNARSPDLLPECYQAVAALARYLVPVNRYTTAITVVDDACFARDECRIDEAGFVEFSYGAWHNGLDPDGGDLNILEAHMDAACTIVNRPFAPPGEIQDAVRGVIAALHDCGAQAGFQFDAGQVSFRIPVRDENLDGAVNARDAVLISAHVPPELAAADLRQKHHVAVCMMEACAGHNRWPDGAFPTVDLDPDRDGRGVCDEDVDDDGLLNGHEAAAGTDPRDPDSDDDGVLDGDDNCPRARNANQRDADNDGQGDPCDHDRDGDGVANAGDNCGSTFNPGQADRDADGQGDACDEDADGDGLTREDEEDLTFTDPLDPDTDGDGVSDRDDNCALMPNPEQRDSDRGAPWEPEDVPQHRGDACSPPIAPQSPARSEDAIPLDRVLYMDATWPTKDRDRILMDAEFLSGDPEFDPPADERPMAKSAQTKLGQQAIDQFQAILRDRAAGGSIMGEVEGFSDRDYYNHLYCHNDNFGQSCLRGAYIPRVMRRADGSFQREAGRFIHLPCYCPTVLAQGDAPIKPPMGRMYLGHPKYDWQTRFLDDATWSRGEDALHASYEAQLTTMVQRTMWSMTHAYWAGVWRDQGRTIEWAWTALTRDYRVIDGSFVSWDALMEDDRCADGCFGEHTRFRGVNVRDLERPYAVLEIRAPRLSRQIRRILRRASDVPDAGDADNIRVDWPNAIWPEDILATALARGEPRVSGFIAFESPYWPGFQEAFGFFDDDPPVAPDARIGCSAPQQFVLRDPGPDGEAGTGDDQLSVVVACPGSPCEAGGGDACERERTTWQSVPVPIVSRPVCAPRLINDLAAARGVALEADQPGWFAEPDDRVAWQDLYDNVGFPLRVAAGGISADRGGHAIDQHDERVFRGFVLAMRLSPFLGVGPWGIAHSRRVGDGPDNLFDTLRAQSACW